MDVDEDEDDGACGETVSSEEGSLSVSGATIGDVSLPVHANT